jgi:hypothetical protein
VHREGDKSSQAARPTAAGTTDDLQSMASISTAGDGLINQPAGDVMTRPPPQPDEGGARKDLTTEAPATDPNCPQRTDRESTCDSRFSFVDFSDQTAEEGQRGTRADSGGGAPLQAGEARGEAPPKRGSSDAPPKRRAAFNSGAQPMRSTPSKRQLARG